MRLHNDNYLEVLSVKEKLDNGMGKGAHSSKHELVLLINWHRKSNGTNFRTWNTRLAYIDASQALPVSTVV